MEGQESTLALEPGFIHVKTPSGELEVSTMNVFFTFASGRWTYDCVSCGAQCCRGHGYLVSSGEELNAHLQEKETLRLFMTPAAKQALFSTYHVHNIAPACFNLTNDGRCEVESNHGFGAKPDTCRLFPFNGFRFVGRDLVVEPSLTLCPLRPGINRLESNHTHLTQVMERYGVAARIRSATTLAPSPSKALALERAVAGLSKTSSRFSTYESYVVGQIELTAEFLDLAESEVERQSRSVEDFSSHLRSLLGAWPSKAAEQKVLDLMVVATPSLRSGDVFVVGRRPLHPRVTLERLPFMLLALAKVVALAVDAGMKDCSYQTLTSLLRLYGSFLAVSSVANCRMKLADDAPINLPSAEGESSETYARQVQVLKALLSRTATQTAVSRLLVSGLTEEPFGRLASLEKLVRPFVGKLQDVDRCCRRKSYRVKRWFISTASGDLLFRIASEGQKAKRGQ